MRHRIGESVGKKTLPYTAGVSISWYNPMFCCFAIALKITNVEKPFDITQPLTTWGNLVPPSCELGICEMDRDPKSFIAT